MSSILESEQKCATGLDALLFENRYARLPAPFFRAAVPHPLVGAHMASFNVELGALLGLTAEAAFQRAFVDQLTGVSELPAAQPVAMAYAGHQFGHFVPQLGDGRALLLGQVRDKQQQLWDLHLKGSGSTHFSRGSDGRAVLRSSIREYLCSEAMFGLGIPTTRALCLIASREQVYRERAEPGAMLLRMAQSHIRFGSFEFFYHRGDYDNLRRLGRYLLEGEFLHLRDTPAPYLALFGEVVTRTAKLIAQWQGVGFCHGVMNSDNMSILGLTLDYGPFAFLDVYEKGHICNHSDHQGRYAFQNQPEMAHFDLACLATAMLPLIDDDNEAAVTLMREQLAQYWPQFNATYRSIARSKLGLMECEKGDLELWQQLLELMDEQVDYTRFFRALGAVPSSTSSTQGTHHPQRNEFSDPLGFDLWMYEYRQRLQREGRSDEARRTAMALVNPKYILRNYMAETAIRAAEECGDYSEVDRLLSLLRNPFCEQPEMAHYAASPPLWAKALQLSCSS